jgi:GTP-binding protein
MNYPIVAIIGRPNVGKSTLFNRILKTKTAIVDDMPGVTRDRNYAIADWNGKYFYLIDTGGLVPNTKDRMEISIKRQVETAMEEADLLLFLVDRKTGLTDADAQIAKMVRKQGKPIILAVNKVDKPKDEAESYEFMKLGLGEPMLIAAGPGLSIGDLLDEVVKKLPKSPEQPVNDRAVNVAIVGKPNVGKSSLVNAIVGRERVIVDAVPGTTRDSIDTIFNWNDQEFVLIDTAGLRRKTSAHEDVEFYTRLRTERAVERCQVGVLVLDSSQGLSHLDTTLVAMLETSNKALVVVINKWDLMSEVNKPNYLGWLKDQLAFVNFAEFVFTSALNSEGVFNLLQKILNAYHHWNKVFEPGVVVQAFEETIKKLHPPAVRGKEITLYSIRQEGQAPPRFVIESNMPHLIPTNYLRYIQSSLHTRLAITGTPIRLMFQKSKAPSGWKKRQMLDFGKRPKFRAETEENRER